MDVALSYTSLMSTAAAMGLISGWALHYAGARTIHLAGGILFGLGIVGLGAAHSLAALYALTFVTGVGGGMVYPGAMAANLIRLFPERAGFVSGWVAAGVGIGGMIWGPLAVWFMEQYGLSETLLIMGAAFGLTIAVCSRLVANAPEAGHDPPAQHAPRVQPAGSEALWAQSDWREMFRSRTFYWLAGLFLLGTTTGMLILGQAAPIVEAMVGASAQRAALAVTAVAFGVTIGKSAWGWVSDHLGRPAVLVLLFAVAFVGLLAMIVASDYVPLVLCMAVVGSSYGGFVALLGPVTGDAFGTRHLGVNLGFMWLTIAVGAYVGPQMGARAAAMSGGDFTAAFAVAAALSAIGLAAAARRYWAFRRAR